MKISEMNNCIEKMRECYKFDDDKTKVRLGDLRDMWNVIYVSIATRDENRTHIEMTRYADELVEK